MVGLSVALYDILAYFKRLSVLIDWLINWYVCVNFPSAAVTDLSFESRMCLCELWALVNCHTTDFQLDLSLVFDSPIQNTKLLFKMYLFIYI